MKALGEDLRCVTFRGPAGSATSAFVPAGEPGPGTPLFLVPALALDGRSFGPLAPLAAGRRVVFWNPPNDLPRTRGIASLAAAALEHADRADMPRRFVIGGTSLGAMVALALTLAAPERVAGLVLAGGAARWSDLGAPMRIARWMHPFVPRRLYHRIAPRILAPGDPSTDPVLAELRNEMARRTKHYADGVIAALTGDGPFDLTARLGEIRAPTLILHSRGDRIAPFAAAERLSAIPGSKVVTFEGGSHLPHISDTDHFLPAIRDFLAAVDESERA